MKKNYQKGIAIFIAVIAVSAILLIVLAISDIAYKEQILTYSGKDSKISFYAADSGIECALFHDVKKSGFYFPTTTTGLIYSNPVTNINCNGVDVLVPNDAFHYSNDNNGSCAGNSNRPQRITTFSYNIDTTSPNTSCVVVQVSKISDGSNGFCTKVDSRGYNNTCNTSTNTVNTGGRNLERALQVNY